MNKKLSFFKIAAVMSIFLLTMGASAIPAALAKIIAAFIPKGYSINTILLISTLPSLLIIPGSIISGMLAGIKLKYKTLALIGILLFIIAGAAPVVTDSLAAILIERAAFGLGLGIISPLGNALVLGLFEDQIRAKMLGMGTVIMNIGAIILTFSSGILAGYGWNYAFLAHTLGIISLILTLFFLPEPNIISAAVNTEKSKVKIPFSVWVISILFGLAFMINYPSLLNMSSLLQQKNLGDATVAALVLMLYTFGGMISGLLFSTIFKFLKRYVVGVALVLIAICLYGMLYSNNVIVIGICMGLSGFSFSLLIPTVFMIMGMTVSPMAFTIASSIFMAVMNLCAFLATYWMGLIAALTSDIIVKPIFVGMIIFIVTGIIFFFVNPLPKQGMASDKQ